MSDSWDSEDFVPVKVIGAVTDKWAGEDAEDAVKDNWEETELEKEEEKQREKEKADIHVCGRNCVDADSRLAQTMKDILGRKDGVIQNRIQIPPQTCIIILERIYINRSPQPKINFLGGGAYQRPKKKPLAERIAEKEAKKKQQEEEEIAKRDMPPGDKHAEKLRLRKIQEEADLRLAREAFGVTDKKTDSGIDSMFPTTEEEFVDFEKALKTKITEFESSKCYATFLEKLFTDLTLGLQVEDCKRISSAINSISHEKDKQKRELDKKKKKKSKITVNVERKDDFDFDVGGDYNAYDDDEELI